MRIGDYTAHVFVDGNEATEHHVELETPTRATCWIVSEEGKTFTIQWRCHAETRTNGSVGWVRVDGIFCGGSPIHPGRVGDDDTEEISCIGTGSKTRDFMFKRIQTSDDDRLLDKQVPPGFGEIFLEIEHGRLVRDRRVRGPKYTVPDDNDKFHETSNKAAHHRIGFGPAGSGSGRPSEYVNLIVNDEPALFFVFRYRPIALLRAHGLVPGLNDSENDNNPSPGQDNPELDNNRSQSIDLQRAELHETIRNLKSELKRLQDQAVSLSEEPRRKRIKSEDSGRNKIPSVSEVIDLTQD